MRRNVIAMTEPKSLNSEQYRTIRTNIEFASVDRQMKSVMITSACPGKGNQQRPPIWLSYLPNREKSAPD